MSLKERLMADMKTAMKAKNKQKTSVLRMLLSEIKYAQAAVSMSSEISDEDSLKVVQTYHKRLTKSLDDFPEGEQKAAVVEELKFVEEYLPKKASEDEIVEVVEKILTETEERQFGSLMKMVMSHFGAAADGKIISRLLREKLS